jgi:hypothetical protein
MEESEKAEEKREQKRLALKKSRLGFAFLMGGAASSILATFSILISCLSALLSVTGFALTIVGYIFLIRGRKALPRAHSRLVYLALVYFLLSIVLSIGMTFVIGGGPDLERSRRMMEEEISGQDIIDTWEGDQESLLPGAVVGSMTVLSWALLVFIPSKKIGRILICVYVILAIILITASLMIQAEIYQENINDVNYYQTYEQEDYQEMGMELLAERLPALSITVIPNLLLIGIIFMVFRDIKKKEDLYQPRIDDKLKDLQLD